MMKKSTAKKKKTVAKKPAKAIGKVTHFFGNIKVAIIKFKQPVKVGTGIVIRGNHKDVEQKIVSMQYDHEKILHAKKGKEVGVKVGKKVKDGDEVFLA